MAKKFTRGHRSVKTKAIAKRYVGIFKARYINLELIPYLILSGLMHSKREALANLYSIDQVVNVLKKKNSNLMSAKEELVDYINHELPYIEKYNLYSVFNLLRIGATLLEDKKTSKGKVWQKAHGLRGAHHKAKHANLMRYLLNGIPDTFWYENTKLAFESFLPGYDTELFIKVFAMTSPRTDFASNIKLALKGYDMFIGKSKFEKNGFLGTVFSILEQFKNGTLEFKSGVRGPKRKIINFQGSISGADNVTADMWITLAFGLLSYYTFRGRRYPYTIRDSEYDVIETYIKGLAEITGFKAKHINAMLWLGIRKENYKRHVTSSSLVLLINAIKKHGSDWLKENAQNKIIMTDPVQMQDDRTECLDYSKPERERVNLVKDAKPGSMLYRNFDGNYRRYCSGCSSPKGCIMCLLP
ncbi:MAG TPA: hypothetical protein PLQ20_00795 [Candidatus Paceibacterota bacterium]|nr:hypothetical protein [Candidatus Paceibacterota bacterium]